MAESARVTLAIRVKPGSSRAKVGGCHEGSRGPALIVAVTARAVDGAATEAALRAVAGALGVRRPALSLVSGPASRDKVIAIETEDPATVAALAGSLRDGSPP